MMHTNHYSTKLLSIDDISVAEKLYLTVFLKPPWKEHWDHKAACQRLEHIANCQGYSNPKLRCGPNKVPDTDCKKWVSLLNSNTIQGVAFFS